MSLKIMSLVWEDAQISTPVEIAVMLALADYANDEGKCWPSIPSIIRKSRCCRGTVYAVIQRMVKKKKLSYDSGGGAHISNRYQFKLKTVHQMNGSGDELNNGSGDELKTVQGVDKTVQGVNPIRQEPSLNRHKKAPQPFSSAAQSPGKRISQSEKVLLNQSLNRICSRLKELSDADLPKAVQERKELRDEKQRILKLLGLKA